MKPINEEQKKQMSTTVAIVAAACVLMWIVYQYVIFGLYLEPRDKLAKDIAAAKKKIDGGVVMKKSADKDSQIWKTLNIMDANERPDAADTMSADVYTLLSGVARQAGMIFETWTEGPPHVSSGRPDFQEIRFQATAHTTTARMAGFLLAMETNSAFPARVDAIVVKSLVPGQDDLHVDLTISALIYSPKLPATRPGVQPTTRVSVPSTVSSSGVPSRGPTTPTVSPEPAVDPKAEEALMARRKAEDEAAAKALAEQEAFNKLTEPEKEAWLAKRRQEAEAAAIKKAADDLAKQKQLEAEMIRKRQQEVGTGGAK